MKTLNEIVSLCLLNSNFAAAFLDAAFKSFLVLALAGGWCLFCRRASAATRHLIWFAAVASLLVLPLRSTLLPSWSRPLWSVSASLESGNQVSLALELAPGKASVLPGTDSSKPPVETGVSGSSRRSGGGVRQLSARFSKGWLVLATVAWCGGVMVALTRIVVGRLRLGRTLRSARRLLDAEWLRLVAESSEELGLRRAVVLLQSRDDVMPLTCGWLRPVVLVPSASRQWPIERRRVVLLHELAHVRRWDCLTQAMAGMACALYWFNPLVWAAARRMRFEREAACDDLVLVSGWKASEYACHLVDIAGAFRQGPALAAIGMARKSGLERRVTAILDPRRNRNRMGKWSAAIVGLAVIGCGFFMGACTTAERPVAELWSLDRSGVGGQLRHFVAEKEAQASAGAETEGKAMLPEYRSMFAAAARGDWLTISNIWEDLRMRAPQYEGRGPKDDRLHGTAWSTVLETWGAFGNIVMGGETLVGFGSDIVAAIRPGSIYFGGTDPGRCVITALQQSHVRGEPFFTLTQNALADGSYLGYVRRMYGGKIYTPTDDDSKKCFDEYLQDAERRWKEKKLKPGEDVRKVEGKVQVTGQMAAMSINGLLARIIFDRNPDREFYVEESFPLDWMYPHLTPNGPILKIHREPLPELYEDIVRQDHEYWARSLQPMIGDWLNYDTPLRAIAEFAARARPPRQDQYVRNDAAQKWASKLRSSIAGVYAWRVATAKYPADQKRMIKEADFAFRQAFAVCPYSPEAVFRYANLLIQQQRVEDAVLVADTAVKLQPGNRQFGGLLKELRRLKQGSNQR